MRPGAPKLAAGRKVPSKGSKGEVENAFVCREREDVRRWAKARRTGLSALATEHYSPLELDLIGPPSGRKQSGQRVVRPRTGGSQALAQRSSMTGVANGRKAKFFGNRRLQSDSTRVCERGFSDFRVLMAN